VAVGSERDREREVEREREREREGGKNYRTGQKTNASPGKRL